MRAEPRPILRGVVAAILTAAIAWTAIRFTGGLTAKTHGWIFGVSAALFAAGDLLFGRLLNELNTIIRATGYSVWQAEQIRLSLNPFKRTALALWSFSILLKVVMAVSAGLLQEPRSDAQLFAILWTGYAAMAFVVISAAWNALNFAVIEKIRDDMASEETAIKEKKRLKAELNAGADFDFSKDAVLKAYTTSAPLTSEQNTPSPRP